MVRTEEPGSEEGGGREVPLKLAYASAGAAEAIVVSYREDFEAQVAVAALRCRGVRARVHRAEKSEVRVPVAEEAEAVAALEEIRRRAELASAARRCPDCRAQGEGRASVRRRVVGLGVIVAGIGMMFVWPPGGVVLVAIGVGAAVFASRDEVLVCPECGRRLDPAAHREGMTGGGRDG